MNAGASIGYNQMSWNGDAIDQFLLKLVHWSYNYIQTSFLNDLGFFRIKILFSAEHCPYHAG